MFGAIVLRDIPKAEARLDLMRLPIQGGFRGFAQVPPAAWHYVSVKDGQQHVGCWCWLNPGTAVVKVYDLAQGLVDADPATTAQFSQMALSGAMNAVLRPYAHETFGPWFGLVNHLPAENFPPVVHEADGGEGSRFEKAFNHTHLGQPAAFLAEFQYAFLRWLVSLDTATTDEAAQARWRALLLAAYNAGEHRIQAAGELFPQLVATLLRQFALLPAEWFSPDSFIVTQASYMIEDMQDSGLPACQEQSQALAAYLAKRRSEQ